MFTNWLTNSVTPTAVDSSTSSNSNNSSHHSSVNRRLAETNAFSSSAAAASSLSGAASASHPSASSSSSFMSSPPDIVLEVGPAPCVRFVAHSIVLGMHSGYLRSAIRLDDQQQQQQQQHHHAQQQQQQHNLVLFLNNVTPEQFAPLLTYMYTGYLDLNVENIFGVLLATHVLHMPRALEICRSFLARAQSNGYLGNTLPTLSAVAAAAAASVTPSSSSAAANSNKIIRPIPSKATIPHLGFIPAPLMHHLALPLPPAPPPPPPPPPTTPTNPLHCYQSTAALSHSMTAPSAPLAPLAAASNNPNSKNLELNSVHCKHSVKHNHNAAQQEPAAPADEDVEVFLDSNDNSVASPEIDCNISVASSKEIDVEKVIDAAVATASPSLNADTPLKTSKSAKQPSARSIAKREKVRQSRCSNKQARHRQKSPAANGGLQIAKAPILACELDAERSLHTESSKVIIDVASCDGPVRFRRILNTAYGHKPEGGVGGSGGGGGICANGLQPERTQESVSVSFHQQMAKAINQRRQMQQAEESENSESSGSGGMGDSDTLLRAGGRSGGGGSSKNHNNSTSSKLSASGEVFVCVYCKHSFKSQYCYQKHAKRHLNPLSLSCGNAAAATTTTTTTESGGGSGSSAANAEDLNIDETNARRQSAAGATAAPAAATRLPQAAAAELLRREVRPLDMNVQYYPCKTCGSKFPSYYFVHKHRKLCHAEEEAQEAENRRGGGAGGGAGGGSGSGSTSGATSDCATSAADR